MELDGARVLVTGGSGGIGSALARAYAAAGAKVVELIFGPPATENVTSDVT